jgi:Domain of unknown function(DUF2779)
MLTKTLFNHYLECPVYAWLETHRSDLLPADKEKTSRIKNGIAVDALARTLYPHGIEVRADGASGWIEAYKAIATTSAAMFRPTIVAGDLSCLSDILTCERGSFAIRKVTASTELKEAHIRDVAFQKMCFEANSVKVSEAHLIHLNRDYVRQGEVKPHELLMSEDITARVNTATDAVREAIDRARAALRITDAPSLDLLEGCSHPERCPYSKAYCTGFLDVVRLANNMSSRLLLGLIRNEAVDPLMVPGSILRTAGYAPEEPEVHIDVIRLKEALDGLAYPLHFLDYETYGPTIPPFDGYRPYDSIPFQFSLGVQRSAGADVEYYEFLARSFADPVPELAAHLGKVLGKKGMVLAWNMGFEQRCNELMARVHPEWTTFFEDVNARLWDPMLLFKQQRHLYYDSRFMKSASLKRVLPVLCPDLAYTDLAIQEGATASESWPLLTGTDLSLEEKEKLAQDMLSYCKRDTEAMAHILHHVAGRIDVNNML